MTPQITTFNRPQQVITLIPTKREPIRPEKAIVLDSGALINLSMNGLLYILEELKKISKVRFFITREVKYEVVDRPLGIPRFELGALRVKNLIDSRIAELPEAAEISAGELNPIISEFMHAANNSIFAEGRPIKIVGNAEMSCLALSRILSNRNVENIIAIDERTTRMLAEKPKNIEEIMSKKLHKRVRFDLDKFKRFSQFRFIRSTELIFVAYKKGVLKIQGPKVLEAALYAAKYHGTSISFEEINELKKL